MEKDKATPPCDHPNGHVHYESGGHEDEVWEQLWCDVCNCYLTPAAEHDFYQRPDFQYAEEIEGER
jgi:hypothetical protein